MVSGRHEERFMAAGREKVEADGEEQTGIEAEMCAPRALQCHANKEEKYKNKEDKEEEKKKKDTIEDCDNDNYDEQENKGGGGGGIRRAKKMIGGRHEGRPTTAGREKVEVYGEE